jgi:hypothetical protein
LSRFDPWLAGTRRVAKPTSCALALALNPLERARAEPGSAAHATEHPGLTIPWPGRLLVVQPDPAQAPGPLAGEQRPHLGRGQQGQAQRFLDRGRVQALAPRDLAAAGDPPFVEQAMPVEGAGQGREDGRLALGRLGAARVRDQDSIGADMLTAFVCFAPKNDGRQRPAFTRWIESNRIDRPAAFTTARAPGQHDHLGRTQAADAASLVEVFESVPCARSREVLVAMRSDTPAGEGPVCKAIKEAIDAVNTKHGLEADLALTPVRIDHVDKGHSGTIADEILKVVDGCGPLIADLTQGNKSADHEVGFLIGLNQGRAAAQDNSTRLAANKRIHSDATIGLNLRHWQRVHLDDTLEFNTKLVAALEARFRRGSATS